MTKDEAAANAALKLALEALNSGVDAQVGRVVWTEYDSCLIADAITAIKEALALTSTQCEKQPTQEPEYLYRVDVSRREEGECTKYDHPLYFHNNADANNYCWTINQAPRKRSSIVIAESCAIKMGTISPQRPWVGLTHDQTVHLVATYGNPLNLTFQTESQLKEKNT